MSVFVKWITGQTTFEDVSAARLDILRRSKRVISIVVYQNGQALTLKGDMENGEN